MGGVAASSGVRASFLVNEHASQRQRPEHSASPRPLYPGSMFICQAGPGHRQDSVILSSYEAGSIGLPTGRIGETGQASPPTGGGLKRDSARKRAFPATGRCHTGGQTQAWQPPR